MAESVERIFVEKDAKFLEKKLGVKVSKKNMEGGEFDLSVTFVSSGAETFDDAWVEIIYLNSEGDILLSIESPFSSSQHETKYIIPKGHSLLVTVATPLRGDSKYYKIVFDNL
ncbi:hypothetical protein [Microbulbifer taiwanensis]|uniref:Uncharacterized protein n=1 Tax=Microbulbifer taiwanensis TaxID=986746 RepID=A0ABW1YPD1_9GAMM